MQLVVLRYKPDDPALSGSDTDILNLFCGLEEAALFNGSVRRSYQDVTDGTFSVVAIYDPKKNRCQRDDFDNLGAFIMGLDDYVMEAICVQRVDEIL